MRSLTRKRVGKIRASFARMCCRPILNVGIGSRLVALVSCIAFVVFGFCVPVGKHSHVDGNLVHSHSHTHSHGDGKPHMHVHKSDAVVAEATLTPSAHIHFSFFGFEFSVQVAPDKSIPINHDRMHNRNATQPHEVASSGEIIPELSSLPNPQLQNSKTYFYVSDFPNMETETGSIKLHPSAICRFAQFLDRPPVPPPRFWEVVDVG